MGSADFELAEAEGGTRLASSSAENKGSSTSRGSALFHLQEFPVMASGRGAAMEPQAGTGDDKGPSYPNFQTISSIIENRAREVGIAILDLRLMKLSVLQIVETSRVYVNTLCVYVNTLCPTLVCHLRASENACTLHREDEPDVLLPGRRWSGTKPSEGSCWWLAASRPSTRASTARWRAAPARWSACRGATLTTPRCGTALPLGCVRRRRVPSSQPPAGLPAPHAAPSTHTAPRLPAGPGGAAALRGERRGPQQLPLASLPGSGGGGRPDPVRRPPACSPLRCSRQRNLDCGDKCSMFPVAAGTSRRTAAWHWHQAAWSWTSPRPRATCRLTVPACRRWNWCSRWAARGRAASQTPPARSTGDIPACPRWLGL